MRISRWLVFGAVLLATAFASADSLPDPKLDILGGVGSVNFTGSMSIFFSLDASGNLQCSATVNDVTVQGTTLSQNSCQLGSATDAFANNTGGNIQSFHFFEFSTPQGPFTAGADSLFQTVIPDGNNTGAVYGGGFIAPCTPTATEDCGIPTGCGEVCIGSALNPDDEIDEGPISEFYLQITGVVLDPTTHTASATLQSSPNAVTAPEPASMLLLGCGIGAIGMLRRKMRR